MLCTISICSNLIKSRSIHLHSNRYLISIQHVRGVGFWVIAVEVQASLSSKRINVACCGTPRSHMTLCTYNSSLLKANVPIHSAAVVQLATVGWSFVLYPAVLPTSCTLSPAIDLRVNLTHPILNPYVHVLPMDHTWAFRLAADGESFC